jgi:hypothetical protein
MPISLRPDRGDVPPLGDPAFDALLARTLRPEEAVAGLQPVVESFAALYAAPVHSGPAAEARALTAFRALDAHRGTAGVRPGSRAAHRRAGRRSTHGRARSRLAGIRLAVATAAVAAVAAGGGAVAAYAGDLPAPMQRLAHGVIGAPPAAGGAPQPELGRPATTPLPGNAAHGLCRAYEQALAHGRSELNPVMLRRLAAAAGGAGQVPAYCARLVTPANPANGHPAHPQHGTPASGAASAASARGHARPSRAASNHGKHGR